MTGSYDDMARLDRELYDECRDDCDFDSIFSEKQKCVYCGYEILDDERCLKVNDTGDIIHRKCWNDYADDNVADLCEEL